MVNLFSKIKLAVIDYYHLIFKSAAINHLRIQEILKNPDGTYQLTVKFNSYSELKNYQRKIRRLTVSLSSAVAMVVVAFIVAPYIMNPNRSSASNFLWNQNSWVAKTTNVRSYGDSGNFTDYSATDSNGNMSVNASNKLTISTPVPSNIKDTSYSSSNITNKNPGFYIKDGALKLLKPAGAGCGSAGDGIGDGECKTGMNCITNVCVSPCNAYSASGTTCAFNGLIYGIVTALDGKLWMDRNLGATQIATSSADTQSYGWYFQWGRRADGHQISTSATTSTMSPTDVVAPPNDVKFITTNASPYDWRNPQSPNAATLWAGLNGGSNNPCPPGFHVPTYAEWVAVTDFIGTASDITSTSTAFASILKLPAAGARMQDGSFSNKGTIGYYWASDASGSDRFVFPSGQYYTGHGPGQSVRCKKD